MKPLDALRLQRAARAAMAGETYHEGVPVNVLPAEEEPANAG